MLGFTTRFSGSCLVASVVVALAAAAQPATPKITDLKKLAVVTADTYDELISTKCPVIFHLSKEDTFEGANELAKELEGFVRVASLNTETQADLIKSKNIEAGDSEWLVKEFGKEALKGYLDLAAARKAAEASNPTGLVSPVPDQQAIQAFLTKAYQNVKIPTILFHDKDEIPSLLTRLALWMGDDVEFGSFSKPPEDLVKGLGVPGGIPVLLAFIPQEDKDGSGRIQFQPAAYDKSKFGAFKFKNLFKFSMILRAEMTQMGFYKRREEAAGGQQQPVQPKGDTKTQPLFEYTADTVDACAKDKLGLCIIGIFDGSPMNDGKEAQLEVLREVQNAPSNKGRILHFMWVDLTCHPSFGAHFGVSGDTLPTVLAVSPKKQAWAQHFGAFEANKVAGFIGGVLSGRNRIDKLPEGGVPVISAEDNCTAVHASLMPTEEEEDINLDDILKEMQEEASEKEEARANDMEALEAAAVDAEMDQKRKRAAAEAARMSKVSNKNIKKKKKKKTKKKNKKNKDEL
eukprot:m.440028 g.440028  ORF g.440028 m.440028 type:complete len:516 (+) comp18456_c0_seq1:137-1684(+)